MKALLVNAYFPPYAPGGAEFSMAALAQGLRSKGVPAVVITPCYGERPEAPPGIDVISIPSPFRLQPTQEPDVESWLRSRDFSRAISQAICSTWNPGDVVHLQGVPVLEAGLEAKRAGCGPVFLTIRDTFPLCPAGWCLMNSGKTPPRSCRSGRDQVSCAWQFTSKRPNAPGFWRKLQGQAKLWARWQEAQGVRKKLEGLDHLFTVSEGFREILLTNGIGTPASLSTVYNLPPQNWAVPESGIPESWRNHLNCQPSNRIILAVGKRSLGKGTSYLVEAMGTVHKKHPEAILLLVGKGYNPPPAPYLRVLQPVSQGQLSGIYALSSVVVIPSIWPEPFSRVFLESMTLSKPIIATNVGGSGEGVIPGESGWLIPAKNREALAGALTEALDLPEEALKMMGRRARVLLEEKFSGERSLQTLVKIYTQQSEIFLWRRQASALDGSRSVS